MRGEQDGEQQREDQREAVGVAHGQHERAQLRAGTEHGPAGDGGEQQKQAAAQRAEAPAKTLDAQLRERPCAIARKLRGQAEKEDVQHQKRADGCGEGHAAVHGEEAHDFPPRGEARADHAAQQRQRHRNSRHQTASLSLKAYAHRREIDLFFFAFSRYTEPYRH